jgi:hypothetical protein
MSAEIELDTGHFDPQASGFNSAHSPLRAEGRERFHGGKMRWLDKQALGAESVSGR